MTCVIAEVEVVGNGRELVGRRPVRAQERDACRAGATRRDPARRHPPPRLARPLPRRRRRARSGAPAPRPTRPRATRGRRGSPSSPPSTIRVGIRVVDSEHERTAVLVGEAPVRDGGRARCRDAAILSGSARSERGPWRSCVDRTCILGSAAATRSSHARIAGYAPRSKPPSWRDVRVGVERDVGERERSPTKYGRARRGGAPSRRARGSPPPCAARSSSRALSGSPE